MTPDTPNDEHPLPERECRVVLADMAFRGPHDQCVEAILAARYYIYEHNGAARREVIEGLIPEENHPIGVNARLADIKLGGHDGFRRWWWQQIIDPGLRQLPDVQPPTAHSDLWQPRRQNQA